MIIPGRPVKLSQQNPLYYMAYEIRIRDASPELVKIFEKIKTQFKLPQRSDVMEKLIRGYDGDQQSIRQLQQRNTELHAALKRYHDREAQAREIIEDMADEIANSVRAGNLTGQRLKSLLKQYSKKPVKKPAKKQPAKKKK